MKRVATSIEIAASPERVWEVLTDFPGHSEWNPFIRSISGTPRAGEKLSIHVQPPGGRGMRFSPLVLAAEPGRELRWRGRLLVPGLFDGDHHFRLERDGPGTILHHGEDFSGLFVALSPASSFEPIERGFEAMNQALKARAEG